MRKLIVRSKDFRLSALSLSNNRYILVDYTVRGVFSEGGEAMGDILLEKSEAKVPQPLLKIL